MIKIKNVYIHWLFLVLIVFCYINRNLETMIISYLIMTIHECAHFFAAKYIGLTPSHITIYPFGLNLKLKNTIVYDIWDEIILYASGPLLNILMSIMVIPFGLENEYIKDFYYKNLMFFLINILPIVPLDGGMILKKILNYKFGYNDGNKIMQIICGLNLMILIGFFAFLSYYKNFNPSFLIFACFILGNVFVQKEKYDTNLLKELVYTTKKQNYKKPNRAKIIAADQDVSKIDIIKKFRLCDRYFVFITDENQKIKNILSQEEILTDLLDN